MADTNPHMTVPPMGRVTRRGLLPLVAAPFLVGVSARAAERTLVVAVATFPDSLMTGIASTTSSSLLMQTYDPLVARNNAGEFIPALAERWEPLGDTGWRFHLRPGVKFHDGSPFTADDVKFTIERVIDPQTAYGFLSRISQVSGVEVVDDHTVDIRTRGVFPILPKGLSDIPIEARHYYSQVGPDVPKRKPMGTGPFVAGSWVPGDQYELTANKAYWRGPPRIDRMLVRQIPEASTRLAALLSGEAHIIEEVPIDAIEQIEASRAGRVVSVPTSVGLVLTYDVRRPPFNDPRVREALDYAVDKELIAKEILKGRAETLQGQLVTRATFGFDPAIKARAFDPAKAKALLKAANFDFDTPVPILTQSGKYVSDVDISNAVAGMLQDVGVKATVSVVESGVYLKQWSAMEMGPIYMVGWYSLGDADFATIWYTKSGKRATWSDPEFERLFAEARSTTDQASRDASYRKMMAILHRENPSMFLFGLPSIYAASKGITGFEAGTDKVLRLGDVAFV